MLVWGMDPCGQNSGGLELLFGKKKKHAITLPVSADATPVLRDLLKYVELNLIQEVFIYHVH
jgi:hypothetical protein